jgi:hypothetical protein
MRSITLKPPAWKLKVVPGGPLAGVTVAWAAGFAAIEKPICSTRPLVRPSKVITQLPFWAWAGACQARVARPSPSVEIGSRRLVSTVPSGWVGQ